MGQFKEFLIENELKKAKQKALGLTHISYNTYKSKSGIIWVWKDSFQNFITKEADVEMKNSIEKESKKNEIYNKFFLYLFKNHLPSLSSLYNKVAIYVSQNENQQFSEKDYEIAKLIEEFVIKLENWNGEKIYRGQSGKNFNSDFIVGEERVLRYKREYTSWTFVLHIAEEFFDNSIDEPPAILLSSILKKDQKSLNIKIFEDITDRLTKFIKNGDWVIESDQEKHMKALQGALDFGLSEYEILVFGPMKVKVLRVEN